MVIIAIDGGGTKTEALVCDENGHVLYHKVDKGLIDYHEQTRYKKILTELWNDMQQLLSITSQDVSYLLLGLSGADTPEDFEELNHTCSSVFNISAFKVVNDSWIIMRSGLKRLFGAVAICGTGTNAAAISKDGRQAILRSLNYITGTYGGGLDIAREALHYAFRSEEKTFDYTILEHKIPLLFGYKEMRDLVPMFYPKNRLKKDDYSQITALTFACANDHDSVAIQILKHAGTVVGQQTAGVIIQLGMEQEVLPVVVGGRVFQGKKDAFNDAFEAALTAWVPHIKIIRPIFRPVVGAYFYALDELNIKQTKDIEDQLKKGMKL